jgi:hypothetical protein
VCDWQEPCDWPDAFLIDRSPEPPLRACFRHLGVLVFSPAVNWPLNLGWAGGPALPEGLVLARMHNSCITRPFFGVSPTMIFGVVEKDPWDDTGDGEAVSKT